MKYYIAIDIGASSGRHIVGWEESGEIKTDEVYRFPNGVKEEEGHLVWDIAALFENVITGIKEAFKRYPQIESLAIDTWGCDYVLMNGKKEILPCYAYRDRRTEDFVGRAHGLIPFEELYKRTGIQFQPFNTLYQLYADLLNGRLESATDFLMIPEYLIYKLTGVKAHEYTNATTTGLVNVKLKEYDHKIIERLGLPERLYQKLEHPKTVAGELAEEVAEEVGGQTRVVLCATHDTASAVEGIPFEADAPYISSGTWSLLGLKVDKAVTDENSRKANYSNEGGAGYIRYQKNVTGMWIVNRLRDELCPNKPWDEIIEGAKESDFAECVNVNDGVFLSPDSMKAAFDSAIKQKPRTVGDYFRCAYTSLAASYASAIEELQRNTGRTFKEVIIVGGGAKNKLLNKLTEEVAKIKVTALPIEATALGNIKVQLEAANERI